MAAATRKPRASKIVSSTNDNRTNKNIITLDAWEAQTNLDAEQTASVAALKEACEKKPLPLRFRTNDTPGPSRAATPIPQGRRTHLATPESRPSTPIVNPKPSSSRVLHWEHPIATPEQFKDWLAKIERSVIHSQESHFHAHLDAIKGLLNTCNDLLSKIESIETEIDSMMEGWKNVEESGKSLKEGCERLLEEKAELIELSENIATRLEYFQELDSASRMLNRPGQSIVLNPDFLLMVERVDLCLDFLQSHREYRDADIFIMRYQQCLTRAMTLIQLYFTNTIRNTTSEIQRQLGDIDLSETAKQHLLFIKFQSISPQLSPLLSELERRAKLGDSQALLEECHVAYCSARKTLMTNKVMNDIKGLDPTRSDLVDLARSGCGYLKQVCAEEFKLYKLFFNSGEPHFYSYLETLCDYLYDDLRPRILHEQKLKILRDVCTVLQALMVLDVEDSDTIKTSDHSSGSSDTEDDQLSLSGPGRASSQPFALRKLRVGYLLQLILQDAQTRLVFRSQAILQTEVKYYVPKTNDIEYPVKLEGMVGRNGLSAISSSDDTILQTPSFTKPETWYPTLSKTRDVISLLHGCVKATILSDIAREAVIICAHSLQTASQVLISRTSAESAIHGRLFLIRHLLILKEMTANLDFELSDRQPDSMNVADALGTLLKGVGLGSNFLLANIGIASGTEAITDARMGIDNELRNSCDAFIDYCSKSVTNPLQDFVNQCLAVLPNGASGETKPANTLPSRPFAQAEKLLAIHSEFRDACGRGVVQWMRWLRLYLETDKTAQVLIPPLQSQIVEEYTRFWEIVRSHYPVEVVEQVMSLTDLWAFLKDNCRIEL